MYPINHLHIYIYIYKYSHSPTSAEQPKMGCIGGENVRIGFIPPLNYVMTGTTQKLLYSSPYPSVQVQELEIETIVAEIDVVGCSGM